MKKWEGVQFWPAVVFGVIDLPGEDFGWADEFCDTCRWESKDEERDRKVHFDLYSSQLIRFPRYNN